MPYDMIIVGGTIRILPLPGEPLRAVYQFVEVRISRGISHFEFRPVNPVLLPGRILPSTISVHMRKPGESIPTDAASIKALTYVYGLESVAKPDTLSPDIIPPTVVGVDTTKFTSESGEEMDINWVAVVSYP